MLSSTTPRLDAGARQGWITTTELADTLTRDHSLPFRTSHAIGARLIAGREQTPDAPLADLLAAASTELVGRPVIYTEAELEAILSPRHFIEVRRTLGGPAPSETTRALDAARAAAAADERWRSSARDELAAAEVRLREGSARL